MNKQELIEKYKSALNKVHKVYGDYYKTEAYEEVLKDLKRLDEHENGHADEAPRYVKNILARLRELPLHDREVWLKTIMGEFEQDFSRAKWREGYEQGKVEGLIEREKVTVPQFVADWYEENKDDFETKLFNEIDLLFRDLEDDKLSEFEEWVLDKHTAPFQTLVNMHQFGYTVEKEKRYLVKMKGVDSRTNYLYYGVGSRTWLFKTKNIDGNFRKSHTRKELEQDNFGWVFDCPGVEIEEVQDDPKI